LFSSLINEIVEYYVELRQRERAERSRNEFNSYTTPRTLFAILRLSQALARLRFTNLVDRGDFEEALRLVMESKRSVMQAQIKHTQHTRREDFQSEIMSLLKDLDAKMARRDSWDGWFVRRDVEELVTRQGFSVEQLLRTIDVYNELYVLEWESEAKTKFGFSERIADYSA
jgi:DNA replication licensing factor MCM7